MEQKIPVHEQQEWMRVTLSSVGDAVITTDEQGNVTFLNKTAQSLTGWTQAEAEGKPLAEIFHIVYEGTREPAENPAARALREGVVVGLANHTLLIAKDGTERPLDDSAAPILNDKGDVVGVVLVFRDISERRKVELDLQKATNLLKDIVLTQREPFLVLDDTLRVVTANPAFCRVFRVEKDETESRLIWELGDRQWNIPRLRELLTELVAQSDHTFYDYEVEHDFPAIGRKVMLLNARRFPSEATTPELILLAIEDITERKQASAALRDSELRYRRLFESANDGILILDAETGKIRDSNPFMAELLGYEKNELQGKELWQIGLFADKQASQAAFRQLQDQGYIRYGNLPLETKTGTKVEVEFVSSVYQVDSQPVIQCNVRDTTARSQLERVTLRAEALADINRRQDEFLAMLSHELRNPLAPIMNALQLFNLRPGNEDPIQQQSRAIIERQIGKLKTLVDGLLEASRISAGKIKLNEESVDMRGTVEAAVETTRPLIDRHQHELTLSLPPEPVWLHADATRIEQVIVNLLTNAAKYTEDGGRISVALNREGDRAVLRVRDTGVGIAPDVVPHVFELFTQAERSLDRSQGGLGIGLALVQKLVEMHRGTVEAHSVLKQGSEFIVRLPLLEHPVLPVRPIPAELQRSGKCCRVLVVDDNQDQADSVATLVNLSGHEVRVAYSGKRALEMVEEFRPDIVFSDIGMPEMDGYQLARKMRLQPSLSGVVLVAMTGYGQDSDRQRSNEAGFDHHLVKPFEQKHIQEVLAPAENKFRD